MMLPKKKWNRILASLLCAAMLFTQLPSAAMAESVPPEDGQIASFEALPAEAAEQTVPPGTALDQLKLPDAVTASAYHVREDVALPVVTAAESIPVAGWASDPAYDGNRLGSYVFTARIEGRTLAPAWSHPRSP